MESREEQGRDQVAKLLQLPRSSTPMGLLRTRTSRTWDSFQWLANLTAWKPASRASSLCLEELKETLASEI